MEEVLEIVTLGRSIRSLKTLKNRQPLKEMFVKAPFGLSEYFDEVILDELFR